MFHYQKAVSIIVFGKTDPVADLVCIYCAKEILFVCIVVSITFHLGQAFINSWNMKEIMMKTMKSGNNLGNFDEILELSGILKKK